MTKIKKSIGFGGECNSGKNYHDTRSLRYPRMMRNILVVAFVFMLSACSAATSTPPTNSTAPAAIVPQQTVPPSLPATSTATSIPQPTATIVPQQASASTALDPCQLINNQTASTLAGASFGPGVEGTSNGLNSCTYSSGTSNVFTVDVAQAPDVNTAQADKDQFLADLQASAQQLSANGLNVTQLPDFADGAVIATANINAGGISVSGSAIGFLKGTIFFGFSDMVIGGSAPSAETLQSEATTVLGELP
jgi:hypothetical protein